MNRLQAAIDTAKEELANICSIAAKSLGEEEAQVFDAHAMVLSDPDLIGQTNTVIGRMIR